jgi:hypothetical protein
MIATLVQVAKEMVRYEVEKREWNQEQIILHLSFNGTRMMYEYGDANHNTTSKVRCDAGVLGEVLRAEASS